MKFTSLILLTATLLNAGCRVADRPHGLASDAMESAVPDLAASSGADHVVRRTVESAGASSNVVPATYKHPATDAVDETGTPLPIPGDSEETLAANEPKPAQVDLTLDALEQIALRNSPALAEASARLRAARGNWLQVGLPPNLVVGYSGQQLGSAGEAEQQGIFLGQSVVRGHKLQLNREVAAWEIQRAERQWEASQLRVLTDVRIGYYQVLIAQKRRQLSKQLVDISRQGAEAAEALFKGEEVSQADPLRAQVQSDTARILLQNAVNQHVEAWRRLAAVLGTPEMALQHIDGDLEPEELNVSWQQELQRLMSESPELAAAMADVEAARWAVQRARAEVVPDVDVQAVLQDDRGTGSTNANLQVSLPLPIWNRNQGGIRKARAEATAAQRVADRVALDLQARLATAYQQYSSAQNQVEQYTKEGGILDKSRRTLELIRAGYRAGEFGVLDLLTVQRTYFTTNLAYLDAIGQLTQSAMLIRGLLLHGSLTQ